MSHYDIVSGPLYTMTKGRDHEIVRALDTHPKAVPWNILNELCADPGLQM